MRKVFALLSVATVLAFASCEEKKAPESTVDTTAVVPMADTTAAAPMTDSTATVDTAAATTEHAK